jgi:ferric-dicitrate binding protein FerR (iron transport regulator)
VTTEPCTRVKEALAAHNVWGDAALLEHAKSCEICTSELAVLKKRRDFRDAFPVLSSIADEGASQRAKVAPSATTSRGTRRHLLIMIAALVAIVGYLTRGARPKAAELAPDTDENGVLKAPNYRIYNLDNALFESKAEGGTVRASITRGVASFHIQPMSARQRFVLALPEGELEVRGTTFVVSIENDKTKQVDVAEGTVVLRLRGHDEMTLRSGQRWPSGSGLPTVSFMSLPRRDAGSAEPPKSKD